MTVTRRFGDDAPFGAWVRSQPALDSRRHGVTVNDVDWMFHRYMTPVDRIGTRDIALLMCVETKTRCGKPDESQQETLWYHHKIMTQSNFMKVGIPRAPWSRLVIHQGFYVLSMSGTHPGDSSLMEWGWFDDGGAMRWEIIDVETLIAVLGFDLKPSPPHPPRDFRRHHKTSGIWQMARTPLGLDVMERVEKRS